MTDKAPTTHLLRPRTNRPPPGPLCLKREELLAALAAAGFQPKNDQAIAAVLSHIARAQPGALASVSSLPRGFERRGELWCLGDSIVAWIRMQSRLRARALSAKISGAHDPAPSSGWVSTWARERTGG